VFKFIIMLLIVGAVAGFLAKWLVPGRNRLPFTQTVLLGLGGPSWEGSLAGGCSGTIWRKGPCSPPGSSAL
jgi:uncharacterized membrane protein YeaQ/YmgE (transglycosylase-associated protein family)